MRFTLKRNVKYKKMKFVLKCSAPQWRASDPAQGGCSPVGNRETAQGPDSCSPGEIQKSTGHLSIIGGGV